MCIRDSLITLNFEPQPLLRYRWRRKKCKVKLEIHAQTSFTMFTTKARTTQASVAFVSKSCLTGGAVLAKRFITRILRTKSKVTYLIFTHTPHGRFERLGSVSYKSILFWYPPLLFHGKLSSAMSASSPGSHDESNCLVHKAWRYLVHLWPSHWNLRSCIPWSTGRGRNRHWRSQ